MLPLRLPAIFVLLAICSLLAADGVLSNGDFAAGLTQWQIQAVGEPPAVVMDAQNSHDGNGALQIVQRDPGSRMSVVQVVPVQPGREYLVSAWMKADGIVRFGLGAALLVGDRAGKPIGSTLPARFRQDSYDWTQVGVRFNSGANTAVSLALCLSESTGSVWFDQVALAAAPAWHGPAGPPPDLSPATVLPPTETSDYQSLRSDVVSPHWAFGKPLDRRLRVAVLAPAMAQRESVELAQRLDCEVTPLMVLSGDQLGTAAPVAGSLSRAEALGRLREKLAADYDVLVLGRVEWGVLTEEINRLIIEKTRAGMGLVYICPKGKRLSVDHPMFQRLPVPLDEFGAAGLAGLPGFESETSDELFFDRYLQAFALGKGRLLVVDYGMAAPTDHHYLTPPTRRWREGFAHYDLYLSFLGKAIRWAAAAKPPLLLAGLEVPPKIAWGEPATLVARLKGTPPAGLRAELAVRRLRPSLWDPPPVQQDATVTDGKAAFELPTQLPAGDYEALLVVRDGATVLDWGSARFLIHSPVYVSELTIPDRTLVGTAASLPVTLRIEGPTPAGAVIRCWVHDAYGRLVGQLDTPLPEDQIVRTDVSCAFSRSIYNRLTVSLLDATGLPILAQDAEFTIPRPHDYGTFQFVMAGDGGDDYIGALLRRQAAAYGVDAAEVPVGPPQPVPLGEDEWEACRERLLALARAGIAPVARIASLSPEEGTSSGERHPCLADAAFRDALGRSLEARVALVRPFSPLGIALGKGSCLGETREFCTAPSCQAQFQVWLGSAYGMVDALNACWGSNYAGFANAVLLHRDQLGDASNWPRWVDWRRSMDGVFAGIHGFGKETVQRSLLDARVGSDDLRRDLPPRGYDWSLLGPGTSLLTVSLKNTDQLPLLRSFTQPTDLRGCWFGGYAGERNAPARQRWAPWKMLFSGLNSAWFYAPYAPAGGNGEIGFRPDLVPYDCWNAAASEISRVKAGIDRLLLGADRDDAAIALVYSRSSALVSALDPLYGEHLPALAAMGELLNDAGFSYRVVAAADLADGNALRARHQVVFLPTCVALAEAEADGLRQFVAAGGVVVADWGAGRYDGHGKRRNPGLLDDLFGILGGGSRGLFQPAGGIPGLLPLTTVDGGIRIRQAWPKRFVEGVPALIASGHGDGVAVYLNFSLADYPYTGGTRAASLHEWLRHLLDREGVPKPLQVKGQWGAPQRVETCRWKTDDLTVIGLLKHPDTPQVGEDLVLTLPGDQYAYDMLAGKALGKADKVPFHLGPGEVKLVSLSSERVKKVEFERLRGDEYVTPAYRISVETSRAENTADRVVHVRVFDPSGFPYPAGSVTLAAPGGVCEYDVPFGLAPPQPGRWRVLAIDAATGIREDVTFTMRSPEP